MSEDPKGFDAGDYNLFRYCHNDPEDLTDPMGLETAATASVNPIETAQLRNPLSDSIEATQLQKIQQAIRASMSVGQQNLQPQQNSQQGGVPAKYDEVKDRNGKQVVQDYTPTLKKFPFQLKDSKNNNFGGSDLKNQETKISSKFKGPDGTVVDLPRKNTWTSSEKLLSLGGRMSETVGSPYKLGSDITGTAINQFAESVKWNGTPYSISTQIRQETEFKAGVPVRIEAHAIEPGNSLYISPK